MEYQLCPKCKGQGIVCKPPWVPGDSEEWESDSCAHTCDMCGGRGAIRGGPISTSGDHEWPLFISTDCETKSNLG